MLKLLENNNRKTDVDGKAPEMRHQFTTDILMKRKVICLKGKLESDMANLLALKPKTLPIFKRTHFKTDVTF